MSEYCHDGSCSAQSKQSHGSSCCGKSCCSSTNYECSFSKQLLELADEAWMEVLKEKIKDNIKKNDNKIDQLAKLVSEANALRWHSKMAKEKNCSDYQEKLDQLFSSP